MYKSCWLNAAVAALLCAGGVAAQQVAFVKWDAVGKNTGASWADAYVDLQTALANAGAGSEIWVAAGTYTPAPKNGSQLLSFALRDGVAMYAGFAGNETRREQRAPAQNPTVLSGDLNGDDGANWTGMQENSDHVVTANGVGLGAVLDGFTIRAGYVVHGGGAGVLIAGASPSLRRCTITTSVANFSRGGGTAVTGDSAPVFTDCTWNGNYAHLGRGGALAVGSGGSVTLQHCCFEANRCTGSTTDGNGGAIYLDLATDLIAEDCLFLGNSAEYLMTSNGYPASGGAMASLADAARFDRCTFTSNRSDAGGAAYLYRGTTRFTSCVFNANRAAKQSPAGGFGGGIVSSYQAVTTLEGCTLHANTATEDAGGIYGNSSTGTSLLVDCIAWANRDAFGQVSESQLKGTRQHHCCVMNMLVARPGEDPIDPAKFPFCTDKDPRFAAPRGADGIPGTQDDDFRLLSGSPCIDSGDPATTSVQLDCAGGLRLLDGDLDAKLVVDIGACEFAHARLAVAVGQPRSVRVDLGGTAGLPAALFVGAPAAPFLVRPFGAVWFDLLVSFSVPLGPLPAVWNAQAPAGSFDLVLQAVVAGGAGAQLTNPVTLQLR